jgi:F0F1-type ATP synthase assembly protein I
MPVNIKLVTGGHKGQSSIRTNVTKNASSVISSVLMGALNGILRAILKLISFIARGVVSVLKSAGEKQ